MSHDKLFEVLKGVASDACRSFGNLTVIELNDQSWQPPLMMLEVRRKDHTVFFPAVTNRASNDNSASEINAELPISGSSSSAMEENAISDPLKIVISGRSWTANLVACGRSVQRVKKAFYLFRGTWQADTAFCGMLMKLTGYGKLNEGGTKICCGITEEEYNSVAKSDVPNQCRIRSYPGGGTAYEAPLCEVLIPITKCLSIPDSPSHRCYGCFGWLQWNLTVQRNDPATANAETDKPTESNSSEAGFNTAWRKMISTSSRRLSSTDSSSAASNGKTNELTDNASTDSQNNAAAESKRRKMSSRRSSRSVKKLTTNNPAWSIGQLTNNESSDSQNNTDTETKRRKLASTSPRHSSTSS